MERAMGEALRALHAFIGEPKFGEELALARKEYFGLVGSPMPGEGIEELRFMSLTEWFIFDRRLKSSGLTPGEEYWRANASRLSPEVRAVFDGLVRAVRSVFLVKKRTPAATYLLDLYTGVKYKQAHRVPLPLGKRDLAELRLIPLGQEWYATDAYCHHPWAAYKPIAKMLKLAKKESRPIEPILFKLMAINTRYERLPKMAKATAYEKFF
jgi:hypothetical protein